MMTQCLELPVCQQRAFMSPDHQEASGLRAPRETQRETNQKLSEKGVRQHGKIYSDKRKKT